MRLLQAAAREFAIKPRLTLRDAEVVKLRPVSDRSRSGWFLELVFFEFEYIFVRIRLSRFLFCVCVDQCGVETPQFLVVMLCFLFTLILILI